MNSSVASPSNFAAVEDVIKHGAKGDGTDDDADAFDRAVTANASSGNPIYIPKPANFFRTSRPITYPTPGTIVFGAGREVAKVCPDGGVTGFIPAADDQRFSDFTIGGASSGTKCLNAIQLGTSYANNWIGERLNIQYAAIGLASPWSWDGSSLSNSQISLCDVGTSQSTDADFFTFFRVNMNGNTVGARLDGGFLDAHGGEWGGNATSVIWSQNGGKFIGRGCSFEGASSGYYINTTSSYIGAAGLYACQFTDGAQALTHIFYQNANCLVIGCTVTGNTVANGNGRVIAYQQGNGSLMSPDNTAYVNYNGVRSYVANDCIAQTGDNSLPTASVALNGIKYRQMYYSGWQFPDAVFECQNAGGSYAWVQINATLAQLMAAAGITPTSNGTTTPVTTITTSGGIVTAKG